MTVGVVDVGSNTVRLLVANVGLDARVSRVREERAYLRLGDDVHRLGRISREALARTAETAGEFAAIARGLGAEPVETIVTAPGRQAANPDELVTALRSATGAPVVVLHADEEGRLAWEGAVAGLDGPPDVVGVVDLGGGSVEVVVGTPSLGPAWTRSLDLGALRVTRALLDGDPPRRDQVERARTTVADLLSTLTPPRPDLTLAVGGTARAISRVAGPDFGADELDHVVDLFAAGPAADVAREHSVSIERAATVLGGAIVLGEVARRLRTRYETARGGLREGAAIALAHARAAAA